MLRFGTDGIRGIVGVDFSERDIFQCGAALKKSQVIVGCDTRFSSPQLKKAFCDGVMASNGSVIDVGVCPTPMVAYLTRKLHADFGAMITASHNAIQYNGIKLFNFFGEKISRGKERQIERSKERVYKASTMSFPVDMSSVYINFLTSCVNQRFKRLSVVLDCANGAMSKFAPQAFALLGADVFTLNSTPNGRNINYRCGSTHIIEVQKITQEIGADLGFAFDGDVDRVIAVDKHGRIYDGDVLMYIYATQTLKPGDMVVGTKLTNLAIEQALIRHKIALIRANVGDKYVANIMKKHHLRVGGEQSGHILLREYLPTGDGLLTALKIAEICVKNKRCLADFIDFEAYHQAKANINVENFERVLSNKEFIRTIKTFRRKLFDGRIVVRKSGTEPVIRVMVEAKGKKTAVAICGKITNLVKSVIM